MEAWKEEITSGKLPFESAAAEGAAGKGAVKREKKCRNLHPDTLNGAFLGTFGKIFLPISRDNRNFAAR